MTKQSTTDTAEVDGDMRPPHLVPHASPFPTSSDIVRVQRSWVDRAVYQSGVVQVAMQQQPSGLPDETPELPGCDDGYAMTKYPSNSPFVTGDPVCDATRNTIVTSPVTWLANRASDVMTPDQASSRPIPLINSWGTEPGEGS